MKLLRWVGACAAIFASSPVLATPPPAAGGLAGAKAYIDWIYRSIPGDRFDGGSIRYAPELQRWLDRDVRAAGPGYVGALDWVPFCDCQDFAPDYRFDSRIVRTAAGVTAHVRLRNGSRSFFRVDLIASRRGWLVSDVHSKMTPSLLAHLRREVPALEKERAN